MPKTSVGESFTVAIISGIEKVWIKRGGVSRFSVKIFLSHSPGNFRWTILYCCIKFGYRESLDRRGGEYQDFPWKKFCLTVPKKFLVEPFSVSLISGTQKVWISEGGVSRFSVENFLSHSAENFRWAILYCCIKFGYRESLDKSGGEYQDFPSKVFFLTVPKNSVGQSFTVATLSGIEKVWIRGGGEYQNFPWNYFCLTVPKNFV